MMRVEIAPGCVVRGCILAMILLVSGCRSFTNAPTASVLQPSNERNWLPNMSVLPYAEFESEQITVRNIRNCTYLSADEYVVHRYDRTFDLSELKTVDFIMVPFNDAPSLAHTMMSFGFGNGQYLGVSVEVRLEEGEAYSPFLGVMNQFEILYVVADERDLIRLRTRHRKNEVYMYRARATPEKARALFVDVMQRVNKLVKEPEFYNTLTNNCTTNIARHVNKLSPGRVPFTLELLVNGNSDRYAYDLGLLDTNLPFESAKREARVNELAERYYDSPDFSAKIRR